MQNALLKILVIYCGFSFTLFASDRVWIPDWKPTKPMTIARAGAAVVTFNDRIYIMGGVDGVNFLNSVESATINDDGTLSDWQKMSAMPEQRGFMSATVFNDRIYVVGGGNGPYGKHLLNTIISAPISNHGKLGQWRTEKAKLLTPRRCAKLVVKNNTLFVLGGFNGALLDTVETTQFLADGKLAKWKMQEHTMTMPRYVNEVKKLNNFAFVLGGHHPTKGLGLKSVEYSNLNRQPLTWQAAPSMSEGRYAFASAVYRKNLYVFGGISGSEYLQSTEKLRVDSPISNIKWRKTTRLPEAMANFSTVVFGKWVYLIGGSTRYQYLQKISVATFNSDGEIGYYGNQKQYNSFKLRSKNKQEEITLPNSGKVLGSIETESYTYIRVISNEKEFWIAAPKIVVSIDQRIRFSEGVYMSNFMSKSLNRQFASILFVGTVKLD